MLTRLLLANDTPGGQCVGGGSLAVRVALLCLINHIADPALQLLRMHTYFAGSPDASHNSDGCDQTGVDTKDHVHHLSSGNSDWEQRVFKHGLAAGPARESTPRTLLPPPPSMEHATRPVQPPPPPAHDMFYYVPTGPAAGHHVAVPLGQLRGGPAATEEMLRAANDLYARHNPFGADTGWVGAARYRPMAYYRQVPALVLKRARAHEGSRPLPIHTVIDSLDAAFAICGRVYAVPPGMLGDDVYVNVYDPGVAWLDAHNHGSGASLRLPDAVGNIRVVQAQLAGLHYIQVTLKVSLAEQPYVVRVAGDPLQCVVFPGGVVVHLMTDIGQGRISFIDVRGRCITLQHGVTPSGHCVKEFGMSWMKQVRGRIGQPTHNDQNSAQERSCRSWACK